VVPDQLNGPVKRIQIADQAGDEIEDYRYQYDEFLNLKSIQENAGAKQYRYDV